MNQPSGASDTTTTAQKESADIQDPYPEVKPHPHPSGETEMEDWQNEYGERYGRTSTEWKGWWESTPSTTAPAGSADLHARGVSPHRAVVGAASGGAEALVRASSERARRARANLHAARSGSQESAARLATVNEADLHRSGEMERRVDAEWKRFFEERDLAEKEVKKALGKSRVEREVDSGRRTRSRHTGAHLAVESSVSRNSTVTPPEADDTQDGAARTPALRRHAGGDGSDHGRQRHDDDGSDHDNGATTTTAESAAVRHVPDGLMAWTLLLLLATTGRR